MVPAIVFIETDEGWVVHDHGPALVMFAKYRVDPIPGKLCYVEFDQRGNPSRPLYREADHGRVS